MASISGQKMSTCVLVIGLMLVTATGANHWMDWWKPGPTRQEGKRNSNTGDLESLQNLEERYNGWPAKLDDVDITSNRVGPSTGEWIDEIATLEKLINKLKERRINQD